MKAEDLYKEGKITQGEYYTYLIFDAHDMGKFWFREMVRCTFLERVPPHGDHSYAWQDGRLSLLRDITHMVDKVKNLMEQNA